MKVFIDSCITKEVANKVIKDIADCPTEDDTIVVYLDCEGAEDDYEYAIHEALRLSGKTILTYAAHEVCSGGVTVFLAGDERYAHNHSRFMIHDVYHEIENTSRTVAAYKRNIQELQAATTTYFKMISSNTKLTPTRIRNEVRKAPEGDWWFGLKDAKKFGMVTHVGFPLDETAPLPESATAGAHAPEESEARLAAKKG